MWQLSFILRDYMHDAKIFEIDYQQQYQHWLKIKAKASQIQYELQKGFTQEDTAIQATYISRKLDDLEMHIQHRANERRRTMQSSRKSKNTFENFWILNKKWMNNNF